MIDLDKIYNEDCEITLNRFDEHSVDLILTSPPYGTERTTNNDLKGQVSINNTYRYDLYQYKPDVDYTEWCVRLFNSFDRIIKPNGVVLWNVSYGSDTNGDAHGLDLLWVTVADIISKTPFMVADKIVWKKSSALPNNISSNKLTRIVEDVFVFCRRSEYGTFYMNKPISSVRSTGQKMYSSVFNYIEAKNNDGFCPLNRATYSSELCDKLLNLYSPNEEDTIVYDPFMGTGTTAVSCKRKGVHYVGSELSADQCAWAEERINNTVKVENKILKKQNLF